MTVLVNGTERGLAVLACVLAGGGAAAQTAPDPRDARIDALEAQVRTLTEMVGRLTATPAGTGTPPATAAASTPPAVRTAASTSPASTVPPSRGPDQTRPVTSSTPGPNAGLATFEGGHPSIHSADDRFVATLHGVIHLDTAGYFQRAAGPIATDLRRGGSAADTGHARDLANGTVFRRARLGVDGRLFGDFEYNVLFDFGGSGIEDAGHVFELWGQYSGLKPFHLRVGAFAPSIGLADQNAVSGMALLERPAIVDIARGIAAGDFREAVQLSASQARWFASAALTTRTVGTVNISSVGGGPSFDQSLGGVARVAALPLKGDGWLVHTGIHASRVFDVADAGDPDATGTRYPVQLRERPELRVDGTRLIDTGAIDAEHVNEVGVELAAQWRNLFVQGEYERIGIERRDSPLRDPRFSGWYVEGGWVLTGERRKYNTGTFAFDGPPVARPLGEGGLGALELTARYSVADLNYRAGRPGTAIAADGMRGGEQRIVSAGLNWYINPLIRLMIDYQHVDVSRLSPDPAAFATMPGAQVGQKYDTVSLRSQLAF